MALPDFPRYRSMVEKVIWIQDAARFDYIWVQEDKTISIDNFQT